MEHKISQTIQQVIVEFNYYNTNLFTKIKQEISIPIENLICPKNRNRHCIPRPQNPFVLYRRNLQKKLIEEYGENIASNLPFISKQASIYWHSENKKIKEIYDSIADMASRVHKLLYPNYHYTPRTRTKFMDDFCPVLPMLSRTKKQVKKFKITCIEPLLSQLEQTHISQGSHYSYDSSIPMLSPLELTNNSQDSYDSYDRTILPTLEPTKFSQDGYDRSICNLLF